MPHGPVHILKRKKNLAVFLGIIGFIALFWAVTMVKIANNKARNPALQPQTETLNSGEHAVD